MRYSILFTCGVLILTTLAGVLPSNGEKEVYDNMIRLHVLANSDSQDDQNLKLKVRDEILAGMDKYLNDCNTKYEAEQILQKEKPELERIATKIIESSNYKYPVKVEVGEEYYPTREYKGVNLPAGNYCSVRVKIGEAKGENWWCVLFPPLCLSGAKPEEELVKTGFTPTQIKMLTETESPKYVLKFKLLEMLQKCFVN